MLRQTTLLRKAIVTTVANRDIGPTNALRRRLLLQRMAPETRLQTIHLEPTKLYLGALSHHHLVRQWPRKSRTRPSSGVRSAAGGPQPIQPQHTPVNAAPLRIILLLRQISRPSRSPIRPSGCLIFPSQQTTNRQLWKRSTHSFSPRLLFCSSSLLFSVLPCLCSETS